MKPPEQVYSYAIPILSDLQKESVTQSVLGNQPQTSLSTVLQQKLCKRTHTWNPALNLYQHTHLDSEKT